jgi:flagellar basal-body rod protein FlgC
MSFFRIFDTAGSGMSAQSVRLNTTASNLANADSVASTPEGAYRAKEPVFAAIQRGMGKNTETGGVRVVGVSESTQPIGSRFEPGNPLANSDGYVFTPNVNPVDELVNMISASRAYQNDVEVMNSAKQLMLKTLELGK